jgi:transcriptional regulator with XRE-family HTH domain
VDHPAAILRHARQQSGLSQAQLGKRLGVSQAAVAKLEQPTSNPTVQTLARALRATGHSLKLSAPAMPAGVDKSLIRRHLELTPAQRIRGLEQMYALASKLSRAGARSRGE